MTLTEINQKLEELAVKLPEVTKKYEEAEYRYNIRFYHLLVNSGMGTIVAKEAEAKLVCEEEGLLGKLYDLRGEIRGLYHAKDCYIAIAANLRALQVRQDLNEQQTV